MSVTTFRSYQISVRFHQECERFSCSTHLKSQLVRASSSITLNLAEGSGKETSADQRRFYLIALGSLRECKAVLDLCAAQGSIAELADQLGAHVYRLCFPRPKQ